MEETKMGRELEQKNYLKIRENKIFGLVWMDDDNIYESKLYK